MRAACLRILRRFAELGGQPRTILLTAVALRLAFLIVLAPWYNDFERFIAHAPNADSGSYHEVALFLMRFWNRPEATQEVLSQNPELAHAILNRPPGYPMVLALVYSIFGMRPFGVIVLQIVLDTLGCWLVLRGLRDEFGTRGSALGGWLYAVNPLLITYTGHVLSESLFVFLLTAALYLLLRLRADAPAWQALLLGLVVGLGVSVRASLLYLAPVLGLMLLTLRRSWAQRGHIIGLYLLGLACVIGVWKGYNFVHYGSTQLTLSGEIHLLHMAAYIRGGMQEGPSATRAPLIAAACQRMQADGLDPNQAIFERRRYYRAVFLDEFYRQPQVFLREWLRGMAIFWRSAGGIDVNSDRLRQWHALRYIFWVYHLAYLCLICVGCWAVLRMPKMRVWGWFFLVAAAYFTVTAGWAGQPRYRLQVFPFSIPMIAALGRQMSNPHLFGDPKRQRV
jgi:4-amino-4-deoxy-L-arabinose transferase-like glycosyltransferase